MNKRIKDHHQRIIKNSFNLIFLSKEEKLKKAKISLVIGKLLIIISIPVIFSNLSIGVAITLFGIIQTVIASIITKRLFLDK
ncbi:MAG: hypothetical protein ACLR9T_07060 [Thomasclavelia sp.]|uniref:hypothetical protein n=1 Tax=Thomasclavelia sp. TaxID=3025757 RepID=UPI00399F024B